MNLTKGDYKVKVKDEEENIQVQKALFKQGCFWHRNETPIVKYSDARALYIEDRSLSYTSDSGDFFERCRSQEIYVSDILKNKYKPVPVEKHIVIEDSCNNFVGIKDSYKEAEELAKSQSNDVTIFKMVEVAKVSSVRTVKRKRITLDKKRK